MKMLESIYKLILFIYSFGLIFSDEFPELKILGIEPNAGPEYGETRVICRFGNIHQVVGATYIKCASKPKKSGEKEILTKDKNETCIQCNDAPKHSPDIIPLAVSIIGDFSDVFNSIPYRYYPEPIVEWIYPRYGFKDGGTFVEVFGRNFLNFDQNLLCGFGSKESQAIYVNSNYIICYTPPSDITDRKLPFSISLNDQQQSRQEVDYVYYEKPHIFTIEPNRGPDDGGTKITLRGQNFNPLREITSMTNKNDTFCLFGKDIKTPGNVISSTEMECISPPSYEVRSYILEITLNNREYTDDNVKFFYYHPPFVYSINPKIGPTVGSTSVTITGSNFENTGYVMCKFGEKLVAGQYKNLNEIMCISPQVEKPGKVHLGLAIRPDEFSSGASTIFRFYDTPIIDKIEPSCGPERGFTQISVIGQKFPSEDSQFIKCVFDGKIFKNATVINDTMLKCDSPSVLNSDGINEKNIDFYTLELSLNGIDISGPAQKFYYYKETLITNISPNFGPLKGNTPLNLTAINLDHKNACNIRVRFSTLDAAPELIDGNTILVRTPSANFSGAVEVQLSLNGKDYDKDTTVKFRDISHTFYYYKFPIITDVIPLKGPTTGNTKIDILGLNLNSPFYFLGNAEEKIVYYRFINENDSNIVYGEIKKANAASNSQIEIESPTVYENKLKALIQLSYNQFDFESIPSKSFEFFMLPNITSIEPSFGPVILEYQKIKMNLDNYYCTENCDKIICKYSTKNIYLIEKGYYTSPNQIECELPIVNSPDSYIVEISFNDGEEFTNNKQTYTFYRPYVLYVEPQMIPSKGHTKLLVHGYGFANSGSNLKVKFGDHNVKCGTSINNLKGDCILNANFINDNLIEVNTFPRLEVFDMQKNKNFQYDRIPIEVSVFNDDFTQNNYTVFYFDEPVIINDYQGSDFVGDDNLRDDLSKNAIKSLPGNVDTFIPLAINSNNILKDFERINQYANYTCIFENKSNTTINKVTEGLISSIPNNSMLKNIFFCQSPEWKNTGDFNIRISLNGKDFSESSYQISITDPLEIFQIEPSCGPLTGDTEIDIYGTGFQSDPDYIFKWGIHNIKPLSENTYLGLFSKINKNTENAENNNINNNKNMQTPIWLTKYNPQFSVHNIRIKSPIGYSNNKKVGGPVYISLTKQNFINYFNHTELSKPTEYLHTNFEYYYYPQPYVQAINPHGSIISGGTTIVVYGAWFQYMPQYGVKPYCKFGDKIVEGEFISTVRIKCQAPPSNTPNIKVPFEISLNKKDFTNSGIEFIYYNDFKYAKFDLMEPLSGPQTGGTHINLIGRNLTNMVNPEEFLCKFTSENPIIPPKIVPAGFKLIENSNQSAIICNSPGGWKSGTKAMISITFDGQNFMDTGFNFYFYKLEKVIPLSGPNTGNGPINIIGGGFIDSKKAKCMIEGRTFDPIKITEKEVKCPMPSPQKSQNFTGLVDLAIVINGIDIHTITEGFSYYKQPTIKSIFPKYGPSKGKGIVKVFGEHFKDDFKNANPACKIGNIRGKSQIININQVNCEFNNIPLIPYNKTLNFSYALNNYSFTEERVDHTFIPYGISKIIPSSGPIKGGSRIEVHGAGFFQNKKAKCRFGVPGYFYYTKAEVINYNLLICSSPLNYEIPNIAEVPFSVPFSIAFNDDEFNPWTETSHYFTVYEEPEITSISPIEGKTSDTTEVFIYASLEKPFSTPSAIIIEEDVIDYTNSAEGVVKSTSSIAYQPITCKFGTFGVTQGFYLNRTLIKCLSPVIQDDSDLGYEDVVLELSLNGIDYYSDSDIVFTFIGPAAGRMLWIYIIISILTALLLIIFAGLISSYWNRLNRSNIDVFSSERPHVLQKRPRYIVQHSRHEMRGDLLNQGNNSNNLE